MSEREVRIAQLVFLIGLVFVSFLAGMAYGWVKECLLWW